MARTFNGSVWGSIGDSIARDNALRREENGKALGGLLDAAKFIEKVGANSRLKKDMEEYYRKKAERQAAGDMALARDVDRALALESLPAAGSLFVDEDSIPDEMDTSLWGVPERTLDNVTRFGFDPVTAGEDAKFMEGFDPRNSDPEEIRRAQRIVGTKADGVWGPKSRAALRAWRA